MKQRCTFTFFGERHSCVRKRGVDGADFNAHQKLMQVNNKYEPDAFRAYVHHELMEAGSYLAGKIYIREFPDVEMRIILTHADMDVVSGQIRSAYDEICRKVGA